MISGSPDRWWRGKRGEWYVVVQMLLFVLVLFGPASVAGLPAWPAPWGAVATTLGLLLLGGGAITLVAGTLRLGHNLTPLPAPKRGASLVQNGIYAWVRHPLYSGLIQLAFGWALWTRGWLTLVYAGLLLLFFEFKARREERWLVQRYPAYPAYSRRVPRFFPKIGSLKR